MILLSLEDSAYDIALGLEIFSAASFPGHQAPISRGGCCRAQAVCDFALGAPLGMTGIVGLMHWADAERNHEPPTYGL